MSEIDKRLVLMFCLLIPFFIAFEVNEEEHQSDEILCRKCGHSITNVKHFTPVPTRKALRQRNETMALKNDTLIQLLENPHGAKFEVVTTKVADVRTFGEPVEEHTWFPGFSWLVAVCPHCGLHLGWKFDPVDKDESDDDFSFIGLILSHLIGSSYADSLLISPKAYQS